MTCESCRDWLLKAEDVANIASSPIELQAHLNACGTCQQLRRELTSLENRWRSLPDSPRANSSKATFLAQIKNQPTVARPIQKAARWKRALLWSSVASLFIVTGLAVLFFWPSNQQVEAQPDVIDQLVEWNLELSEAPPADRERLYAEQQLKYRERFAKIPIAEHERELADHLLANRAWLVQNDDPVEELQRFDLMADRLLERVHHASDRSDSRKVESAAKQYAKVMERGIDRNLVKTAKIADPVRKAKIRKVLIQDASRDEALLLLIEKVHDAPKKDIRRAIEMSHKRQKAKKN